VVGVDVDAGVDAVVRGSGVLDELKDRVGDGASGVTEGAADFVGAGSGAGADARVSDFALGCGSGLGTAPAARAATAASNTSTSRTVVEATGLGGRIEGSLTPPGPTSRRPFSRRSCPISALTSRPQILASVESDATPRFRTRQPSQGQKVTAGRARPAGGHLSCGQSVTGITYLLILWVLWSVSDRLPDRSCASFIPIWERSPVCPGLFFRSGAHPFFGSS
jgi:hypothetical protein